MPTVSIPCPTCEGEGEVYEADRSFDQNGGRAGRCPDCRGRCELEVEACDSHPSEPGEDCSVCRTEYRAQRGLVSPVEPFFTWAADVGLYPSVADAMDAWAMSEQVNEAA